MSIKTVNKISNQEFKTLKEDKEELFKNSINLGNIEISKYKLLKKHEKLEEKFNAFIKTLEDKYGDITIHLDTGEIFENED
jgi:hypothetical protein